MIIKTMAKINFYAEGIGLPRIRRRIVSKWIAEVCSQYGKAVGEISYLFCDDEYILKANREFLDHDYYTDIITFDSCEADTINGDLLISLDTVRSNARTLGIRYEDELHRVIIHGILHLCGLKDKSKKDEAQMRAAEEEALVILREVIGSELSLLHT